MKAQSLLAPVASGLAFLLVVPPACVVDPGECIARGVEVSPCITSMRVGQTVTLRASVTADPAGSVEWLHGPAVDFGFDASPDEHSLRLVGTTGIPGVYSIRARGAGDPTQFGDAVVVVGPHSYGHPLPPIQIGGADFPNDQGAAVAVGGDRTYFAYADPGGPEPDRGAAATNFFVAQIDLGTGSVRSIVPDQFLTFVPGDGDSGAPNVAADCLGNGYWIDREDLASPPRMIRMTPGGATSSVDLAGFDRAGPMAVACDGTEYFLATVAGHRGLFRAGSFGAVPEELAVIGLPSAGDVFESIAVDPEGRILLGDRDPQETPAIARILPDGSVDDTFDFAPTPEGMVAIATDGLGVVYGATSPAAGADVSFVRAFNSLGARVFGIKSYVVHCPSGCTLPECEQPAGFESILSLGAAADGRLRVVDDVTIDPSGDPTIPDACRVTVRLISLDP